MKVSKTQLHKFEKVIDTYRKGTTFPIKNNWVNQTNNKLWLKLVQQVNVVGGVNGNERLFNRPDLVKRLSYSALSKFNSDKLLSIEINNVLREAGIRYASANLEKCIKTKSILHNFKYISRYKGGIKGLLKELSQIKGENAELERVYFLTSHLKFIKNKSARDFLMTMGMNKNTIAIDIRIQNIFKHYGLLLPSQVGLNQKKTYELAERSIIEKICKPLEIEPMKFDRILFQNHDKILKN